MYANEEDSLLLIGHSIITEASTLNGVTETMSSDWTAHPPAVAAAVDGPCMLLGGLYDQETGLVIRPGRQSSSLAVLPGPASSFALSGRGVS